MNTMVTRGREWTKMEHTRNFFFDKVNKTWYHIKYDNTAPRTAFLFTFLPYNMDRAWTYEGGREHTANGGFTMTHKITHGENVIQEGEMVFDIKANDGSKFEMEHLHKMTMTEESPFYGMVFWWTGRYGKNVERKMTFVFDKINKSFLFVPKMSMNTVMTIDGEKSSEFVFDNTQAKKHIKFFWAPDAFTKEYLLADEWEYPAGGCKWTTDLKRGGVSIWNWVGDYSFVNNANRFELKTMDKVVQTPMSPFYGLDHFYVGKYYKMKIEEHNILDGKTWYHIKYDNTAPRTAFLFTFLPYNMDRAWTYEGGREHTANGGFTMTHKITHGENVIQEGEMVFDVKANDGSKFEMEHLHKVTMTEESPFYGMVFWWTGRYGKNVERKMTFVFDEINKSFLFVPKMSMNTVMTIDGEKSSEFVFDNTQA